MSNRGADIAISLMVFALAFGELMVILFRMADLFGPESVTSALLVSLLLAFLGFMGNALYNELRKSGDPD
jgi:hypothetical protein